MAQKVSLYFPFPHKGRGEQALTLRGRGWPKAGVREKSDWYQYYHECGVELPLLSNSEPIEVHTLVNLTIRYSVRG